MSLRQPSPKRLGLAGLALLVLCASSPPARAGVRVALLPSGQDVAPGSDFDLSVEVTEAGSEFNGFDFVIEFDPAAVTFVPLAPTSLQQGCLMTGACSGACGSTFHVFSAQGDSLDASSVLLCNQFSLTGPGQIYKLRFHASNTPQITQIRFRRRNFYDAGLYVAPVQSFDAMVGIGVTLDVGDRGGSGPGRVRVEPNPSRGRVAFVTDGLGAGISEVEILDLQGRLVRRLGQASTGSTGALTWDGTDARGMRVSAGVYLALVRRGESVERNRVILLP